MLANRCGFSLTSTDLNWIYGYLCAEPESSTWKGTPYAEPFHLLITERSIVEINETLKKSVVNFDQIPWVPNQCDSNMNKQCLMEWFYFFLRGLG